MVCSNNEKIAKDAIEKIAGHFDQISVNRFADYAKTSENFSTLIEELQKSLQDLNKSTFLSKLEEIKTLIQSEDYQALN